MNSKYYPWVLSIALVTFSPAALAYLDPGTGSMLISAIIGLLASLALAIKTYWYRFIGLLRQARGRISGRGNSAKTMPDQQDGQSSDD